MTPLQNLLKKSSSALAVAVGLTVLVAAPQANAVTNISSSAYGLDANLSILSLVGVGVGPVAVASGTAPPAYNNSQTVASLSSTTTLVPLESLVVTTGVLTASASSPFATLTSTPTGTATATVNGLSLNLGSTLSSILGVSATTVTSTSSVSGSGFLNATGSTSLENLLINGSAIGSPISLSGTVMPSANDIVFNSGGLLIELNRQVPAGNGTTSDGITTDAIYIDFTNFILGTGLLNGDIIVSQSQADILGSAQAVPEPGVWALMLIGFAGLGVAMRARRRRTMVV